MDAGQIISLLGALGIGSVIGQYLGSANERRVVRAAALKALAQTESARWVSGNGSEPPFPETARDLEAAALVARLPRDAVVQYLTLAHAAFWTSQENYEQNPAGVRRRHLVRLCRCGSSIRHPSR